MSDLQPTDSLVVFGKYWETRLKNAQADLGFRYIAYGDQLKIPRTPAVCIEPGTKVREDSGYPRGVENTLQIIFLVYLMKVGPSVEVTRAEADMYGEALEAELHKDPQCDGLVYRSLVKTYESGYTERDRTLFRSARLTLEGISKTQLPTGGV